MVFQIKNFFRRIKRLLAYAKIIWQTDDWDYAYSLMIFKFSLLRLAQSVEEGHGSRGKDQAKDIRRVCTAIQRIIDDKYDELVENEEIDTSKMHVGFLFSSGTIRLPKRSEYKKMEYLYKQDWDYINKILKTKIRTWWD